MSCNHYTDTQVRARLHFSLTGISQKPLVSYIPEQSLFLDLIHHRLVTKTQCFGSRLRCILQMGGKNLSGGSLRKSYFHSLLHFTISPARILIKNLIMSKLSNVHDPCMFPGCRRSKDTAICPVVQLLGSFLASDDRGSYKSTTGKDHKRQFRNITHHRQFRNVTHHRQFRNVTHHRQFRNVTPSSISECDTPPSISECDTPSSIS